jgi:cobalamin biosynthesis protein CobD/CbiB
VYLARAVGAALGIGLAVGLAMALADRTPLVAGNLRWLIHPLGLIAAGYLAGEGVSRATRHKRGRLLQGVAIAGVVVALATLIVLTQGLVIGFYTIVGFGVAVALAMNPLR